jgi:DNA-binding response OmpR family regulator
LASEHSPYAIVGGHALHLPTKFIGNKLLQESCKAWHGQRYFVSMRDAKRILLADDDPGVLETLGRVLESELYEVIRAKTGNETARLFVSTLPDMVLLDLNMPERDGWSACRFISAAEPMIPIIIITARPNQYQQAVALGVDALMEKPLNLPLLLNTIEGLLTEGRAERARRRGQPDSKTVLLARRS